MGTSGLRVYRPEKACRQPLGACILCRPQHTGHYLVMVHAFCTVNALLVGELYFLRILLNHIPGATMHRDLRCFEGKQYPSYKETAVARGLLHDDREWDRTRIYFYWLRENYNCALLILKMLFIFLSYIFP